MLIKLFKSLLLTSFTLVPFLFFPKLALAATYYVSAAYNGTQTGTLSQPWKTIQQCLEKVQRGDICEVFGGTYNEALTLKTTGTQAARIILKNYNNQEVTVNSGSAKTLVTSGNINYYTIDGLRLITTGSPTGDVHNDSSLHFSYNWWGDGYQGERGNDGFILRNCYIEGAVSFYGSDNLVENCELNGKDVWMNGLIEKYEPSENNIFRNNKIHDYTRRGGWSLQYTNNTLWERNIVYNNGWMGIDCDGAGHPVYYCNLKDNVIYDIGGGTNVEGDVGILLENTFNSIIERNTIYNIVQGIGVINYNRENGSDFHSDGDYKSIPANTIIRNNIIYNVNNSGILCKAVVGNKALNNTIYNTRQSPGYWAGIAMAGYDGFYCHNWEIQNNIVSQSARYAVWWESAVGGLNGMNINNNFYDGFTAYEFIHGGTTRSLTFTQWQAAGKDTTSKTGNPLFVNAVAGDFHLQGNSPACGMGAFPCGTTQITPTPTPTKTSTPTPTPTKTPTPTPTPNYPLGDINHDGVVDLLDFVLVSNAFGTNNPNADLNSDGRVDLLDFVILSNNFGRRS